MGRIKSAAQKLREANIAKERERVLSTRPANITTTVQRRKTDRYIYRAYSLKNGANQQLLSLTASAAAVDFFGITSLGLQLPSAVTDPTISKPDNFKPAMVMAMVGAATPTAKVNGWGSRVIKYSAGTDGTAQSHYSAPICVLSGTTSFDTVDAQATGLFNSVKSKLGNEDYARFYVTAEQLSVPKV